MNGNSVTWVIALNVNKLSKSKPVWLENQACSMYRRHGVCSKTQKIESERMWKIYKQQAQGRWNSSIKSFTMDLKWNKITEIRIGIKMIRWLTHWEIRIIKNTCFEESTKAMLIIFKGAPNNWILRVIYF